MGEGEQEQIVDPIMEGKYDMRKMEALVGVALHCVDEVKDARPNMSQVDMVFREVNADE